MKKYPTDINGYWADRKDHDLYAITNSFARAFFRESKSAIDVGCYTSGLICDLDWIPRRVASDVQNRLAENWKNVDGVMFVAGDAFDLKHSETFDLVISNQTVEHLDDPRGFIDKLLSLGRGLIVSTTYEVEHGLIPGHVQDPISLSTFESWFVCGLDAWAVCHHPTARHLRHIVGVVKQSHPNAGIL